MIPTKLVKYPGTTPIAELKALIKSQNDNPEYGVMFGIVPGNVVAVSFGNDLLGEPIIRYLTSDVQTLIGGSNTDQTHLVGGGGGLSQFPTPFDPLYIAQQIDIMKQQGYKLVEITLYATLEVEPIAPVGVGGSIRMTMSTFDGTYLGAQDAFSVYIEPNLDDIVPYSATITIIAECEGATQFQDQYNLWNLSNNCDTDCQIALNVRVLKTTGLQTV